MNNKRIVLKEEQTVNEVQLKDLFTAASNVEKSVISLADASIAFSNPEVKRKALAIKAQVTDFTKLLGDIVTGVDQEEIIAPLETPSSDKPNVEELPTPEVTRESVDKNVLKLLRRLSEALEFEDEEVEETPTETEEAKEVEDVDLEKPQEENVIDLSPVFSDLLEDIDESKIMNAKGRIIEILKNSPAQECASSFESVIDADSFNYAMDQLYTMCDNNEIKIHTL